MLFLLPDLHVHSGWQFIGQTHFAYVDRKGQGLGSTAYQIITLYDHDKPRKHLRMQKLEKPGSEG